MVRPEMQRYALDWIKCEEKRTQIAFEHAERRAGVKAEELENLRSKMELLGYFGELVKGDFNGYQAD